MVIWNVIGLMAEFESENKKTQIPDDLLARVKDVVVDSVKVENNEMLEIMKKVFNDNGGQYCICPHTAVGAAYHYQNCAGSNQVQTKCLYRGAKSYYSLNERKSI